MLGTALPAASHLPEFGVERLEIKQTANHPAPTTISNDSLSLQTATEHYRNHVSRIWYGNCATWYKPKPKDELTREQSGTRARAPTAKEQELGMFEIIEMEQVGYSSGEQKN